VVLAEAVQLVVLVPRAGLLVNCKQVEASDVVAGRVLDLVE
jgi:hypothetical protein